MTLRTTSIRRQHQAWACLALLGVVAYFVLVSVLGLGNPFRFFGAHQMRVLLPLVVLLRILAREFRWDGIVREEVKRKSEAEEEDLGRRSRSTVELKIDSAEQPVDATSSSRQKKDVSSFVVRDGGIASTKEPPVLSPTPTQNSNFSAAPAAESPEALWERARVMVHNVIPDLVEDAEYLNLVFSAAEQGYVPALAKLGDYAFRRGAFVEAYFWTKVAKRRLELSDPTATEGLKEIEGMLRNIRREWTAVGQPPEYENLYDRFSEERGRIGRAFLRIDSGILVEQAGEFIQGLAKNGNPDAALFVKR